jgi:FkbM family methyltransferase
MKKLIKLPFLLRLMRTMDFPHKKGIMDKLFKSSFTGMSEGWVEIWTGHQWKIDFRNPCHRWMMYDRYADSQFLKWAERHLPPDAVIIDSGSNIGQFLPYYALIAPKGTILAFEPGRALAAWISECVSLNQLNNVEVIAKGLGDKEMDAFLSDPGEEEVKGLWNEVSTVSGEPIIITTLRTELAKRNIQHIDLWKLDVEGYEVEALQGVSEFLDEKKIKALYIEMAIKKDNHKRILEYMTGKGYKAFEIATNGRLIPMLTVKDEQVDALFLPA